LQQVDNTYPSRQINNNSGNRDDVTLLELSKVVGNTSLACESSAQNQLLLDTLINQDGVPEDKFSQGQTGGRNNPN
jgi:hypothetical protein